MLHIQILKKSYAKLVTSWQMYKDLVGKIQRIADFVAKAQVMPKEENEVWLNSNQLADTLK